MARNPRNTRSVYPIGRVHSPLRKPADAPKQGFEGAPEIGVHRVRVRAIEADGSLLVQGLEAIDGTPVLDIKPALPQAGGW